MGVEIVGFLGLGAMGSGKGYCSRSLDCAHCCSAVIEVCAGLASNLQRFLKDQGTASKFYGKLHVWNRSPAKAAPLQELGASLNPSAAGTLPVPAGCLDAGLASCCLAFQHNLSHVHVHGSSTGHIVVPVAHASVVAPLLRTCLTFGPRLSSASVCRAVHAVCRAVHA